MWLRMTRSSSAASAGVTVPAGTLSQSISAWPLRTVSGVRKSCAKAALRRRRSSICAQRSRQPVSSEERMVSKLSVRRPSSSSRLGSSRKARSFCAMRALARSSSTIGPRSRLRQKASAQSTSPPR